MNVGARAPPLGDDPDPADAFSPHCAYPNRFRAALDLRQESDQRHWLERRRPDLHGALVERG